MRTDTGLMYKLQEDAWYDSTLGEKAASNLITNAVKVKKWNKIEKIEN